MADTKQLDPASRAMVEAAEVAKVVAGARKAVAEADSAQANAAADTLKSSLGSAPSPPFSGSVEVAEGAGLAELNYLASEVLVTLAKQIARDVSGFTTTASKVFVTSRAQLPEFSMDSALSDRTDTCTLLCQGAIGTSNAALGQPNGPTIGAAAAVPLAATGLVLASANAALGFLRSDFRVAGTALAPTDLAFVLMLAGQLKSTLQFKEVFVEGFLPPVPDSERSTVREALATLSRTVAEIRLRVVNHAAALVAIDASPVNGVSYNCFPGERELHLQATAACQAAIDAFDAFAASLYADAQGTPFLERALLERTLRRSLGKGVVLSVRIEGAWGSSLVTKGIRAGFGRRVPLKVRSSASVSWGAYEAASGALLGSGLESASSKLIDIQDI